MAISEQWRPKGGGGILASYLIAKILRGGGFKLTVVHSTQRPMELKGVKHVYTGLLSARVKYRLWLNCSLLTRQPWFRELVHESDVVYVPRYCYPIVPFAKELGKKVIIHFHDYQSISHSAAILCDSRRRSILGSMREIVEFELGERESAGRAVPSALASPLNRLARVWVSEADVIICVSRRQAEIVGSVAPELAGKLKVIYNPLFDVPMIEKKLKEPYFMYVGGDSYVKGLHLFLEASYRL